MYSLFHTTPLCVDHHCRLLGEGACLCLRQDVEHQILRGDTNGCPGVMTMGRLIAKWGWATRSRSFIVGPLGVVQLELVVYVTLLRSTSRTLQSAVLK